MELKHIKILQDEKLSLGEKATMLILFNISDNEGMVRNYSLLELSDLANITKPTLLKTLNSLEQKGLIVKNKHNGKYAKNTYKICV